MRTASDAAGDADNRAQTEVGDRGSVDRAGAQDRWVAGPVAVILPNHERIELAVGMSLLLGRESPNELVARAFPPEYVDVSRYHVRIVNDANGVALEMLGETGGANGTFIDGRRLPNEKDERVPLEHGERFRLGTLAWCKVEVLRP